MIHLASSESLDHAIWFAARAAGLVAYLLATASVLFGLATATRAGDRVAGRGAVADVHRALALLTVVATGAHVLLLALNRYAGFGLADLFVPFATWYRPFWTGIGVLAAYGALAVYASFYARSRIGYQAWRAIHLTAFAVFAGAAVHGLMAGRDSGADWAHVLYAVTVAAVVLATAYRVLRGTGPQPVWAWEPRAGEMGEVRLTLAAATVAVGALLTVAALVLPPAGPAAGQAVAAAGAEAQTNTD